MNDAVRVAVVGAGTMGAGIAGSMLDAGLDVALVEPAAAVAAVAEEALRGRMARRASAEVGASASGELVVGASMPSTWSPALVVEAVPERLELKRDVLAEVERACPSAAVLATNTSSLSIDRIADGLVDPRRLIGMHFFNPVPASTLVEIVVGGRTAPDVILAASHWVARLGKTAIEVQDSPGFATSRLGVAIGLEAIRMLETGVASAEDIDRGMVLGYKFPVGPLELTDRIGLDVRLAIADHLADELGDRFQPPELLRAMVARGQLGRKVGNGFYRWGEDGRRGPESASAAGGARRG